MENFKISLPDLSKYPNPYNGIERVNKPITDIKAFTEYFNTLTEKNYPKSKKYYCVMLFFQESDITGYYNPATKEKWINTRNVYFHNGTMALEYYINTKCPTSQLIDAETIEELAYKRNQMLNNFKNKKFIHKLYKIRG